jgi:hypothetical protein
LHRLGANATCEVRRARCDMLLLLYYLRCSAPQLLVLVMAIRSSGSQDLRIP